MLQIIYHLFDDDYLFRNFRMSQEKFEFLGWCPLILN